MGTLSVFGLMGVSTPLELPPELLLLELAVLEVEPEPVLPMDDVVLPDEPPPELLPAEVDVELVVEEAVEPDAVPELPDDDVSLLQALKASAAVTRASVELRLMVHPWACARGRAGAS